MDQEFVKNVESEINSLREEFHQVIMKYSLTSIQVLEISRQLDRLILLVTKK